MNRHPSKHIVQPYDLTTEMYYLKKRSFLGIKWTQLIKTETLKTEFLLTIEGSLPDILMVNGVEYVPKTVTK